VYDDELELNVGDVIEVLRKAEDPGWMEGRLNGKIGFFAVNLVSLEESVDTGTLSVHSCYLTLFIVISTL
jgi:hypothetical protein